MRRERHGASARMRHGKALQHRKILERAEPVAQPLRLRDPELSELRPQRLDQLHLIAVRDHDGAQFVQHVGLGLAPVLRRILAQTFVCSGQLAREVGERQLLQIPGAATVAPAVSSADPQLRTTSSLSSQPPPTAGSHRAGRGSTRWCAAKARLCSPRDRSAPRSPIAHRARRTVRAPDRAPRCAAAAHRRRERVPAAAAARASASSPCGSRGPRPRRAFPRHRARCAPRTGYRARRPGEPRRPQHPDARRVSRPCEAFMTAICHNLSCAGGRVFPKRIQ